MTIGAVILAAGEGRRLGGVAKALLGAPTFLARVVTTARADDVVVVVGPPFGARVADEAARLGARVAWNPDPARGMASSIALGFAAVRGARAWLWPVDHPAVTRATLDALCARDAEVVRPRYRGRGGHPPLVRASLFGALAAMTGTAREVFAAAQVIDVEVDDPGVVRDVDAPEDL